MRRLFLRGNDGGRELLELLRERQSYEPMLLAIVMVETQRCGTGLGAVDAVVPDRASDSRLELLLAVLLLDELDDVERVRTVRG